MSGLGEWMAANAAMATTLGGVLVGGVFGWLVFRTNFCTMGSVSDIVNLGDWRRFRSWLLAAAVAIVGTQALAFLGVVDLGRSMYMAPNLNWAGNLLGGAMFGVGMVFAGGCASRNLARVGGGDLRSLLTLVVLGIFGYMAIGGLLGPLRAELEQATAINLASWKLASSSLAELIGLPAAFPATARGLLIGSVIAGAVAAFCFVDENFRTSPVHIVAGLGIGLCAVAGWAVTGLAFDELAERPVAPISLTYVRPTGDALEWLQRYTAIGWPGFGVGSVAGAILGSFLAAKSMGRFQFTTFSDKGDTLRNLVGAALMGVGGVLALGCTVGQAITGVSTLAIGSFLTFAAIVAGGVWGMKLLERWLMAED
jgi:uncharacterized membrane protein YedE/YeeE